MITVPIEQLLNANWNRLSEITHDRKSENAEEISVRIAAQNAFSCGSNEDDVKNMIFNIDITFLSDEKLEAIYGKD